MRAEYLSCFEARLAAIASPSTARTYRRIVCAFFAFLGPRPVEGAAGADVERFLARPRRTGKPASIATLNLEIVALRAFFRVVAPEADPTAGLPLRHPERREPSVPTLAELGQLFEAAAGGRSAARDLAMLALLFQAGLRVHELVALTAEQIDLTGRTILGLRGKGGTRTDQPLGEEAAVLLEAWAAARGAAPGPLFPGRGGAAVSVRSVQRLMARLRSKAGIAKRLTPHSLRHGTATLAIARGIDLPTTAALMRHARLETTLLYVALASEARRTAANRLGSAIPRSVLPQARNLSGNAQLGGVQMPVDAEHELCDAFPVVERPSAPPGTSHMQVPAAPQKGAAFVHDGSSRAASSEREEGRDERERDGDEDGRGHAVRSMCGACACRARMRREWYARRRARAVVAR